MIWIAHKAANGDTLASIVKQYKNKDQEAILKYHMNKKIAPRLKKGESLKKGDVVWVLNPKTKAYLVSNGKTNVLLDERGYKNTVKEVHRVMDRSLEQQRINFQAACDRHNAQIAINEDQSIVYSVVSSLSRAVDPMPKYKTAEAAYKKLMKAVSGRDYKGFQKALVDSDLAVSNYNNAVVEWVHGLIDTTSRTVTTAKYVRAAGEFACFAIIVTACPPAGLGAGVALSAGASAGIGLAFDGYDAMGRAIVGEKQMKGEELAKRMMANAITGAAGGLLTGLVVKAARPLITPKIMNPTLLNHWSERAAKFLVPKKIMEAELQIAVKQVTKQGGQRAVETAMLIQNQYAEQLCKAALKRTISQLGTSAVFKTLSTKFDLQGLVMGWMKTSPNELKGKDMAKIGQAAANYLMDAGIADNVLEKCINANMDKLKKNLRELMIVELRNAEKKAA